MLAFSAVVTPGPAGIAQAFVFLLFSFAPSYGFGMLTTLMWRVKFVELTTLSLSCVAIPAVLVRSCNVTIYIFRPNGVPV